MKATVSNFKLGLFIIVGTALLVFMIVLFGAGVFSPKGLELETYIDGSVQGLDVGSPLKYRGVTIGRVTGIELANRVYEVEESRHARYVVIRMEIDPDQQSGSMDEMREGISQWIDEGMRLRMASQGITGIAYMEMDFVEDDGGPQLDFPWTPETTYIPSAKSQLAKVADSIESIAKDLEEANIPEIASDIKNLLVRVEGAVEDANIREVSNQIRASLDRISEVADSVDAITSDPKMAEVGPTALNTIQGINETVTGLRLSITEISVGLNETMGETRQIMAGVRDYMEKSRVEEAFERTVDLLETLDGTLSRIEVSYDQKDEQVTRILQEIRIAAGNLRDMSEVLSRYPSLAAFGDAPAPSEVYKDE